jgi:hypothetical protein
MITINNIMYIIQASAHIFNSEITSPNIFYISKWALI